MKVSFITRHNIINYGSVLQTIALQKMIERFGYQAEVIDYIRTDEDFRNISKVLANRNAKCQKSCLFKMFFITGKSLEFQIAGKKFEQIRNRYLKVSKRYSTLKELRENPPEADIYMTGSDQVWGGIGEDRYDSAFFLDFGDSTKKRLSYAASFGRTDMSEDILKIYSELLKKYSVISVREESARQILINQGYSKTIQVLDPTLLLTSKEWDNIVTIEASRFKKPASPYILVYQRRPNKEIDRYAEGLSKHSGYPVYRITADFHQGIRGGKMIFLPNMHEFIDWIKNAEFLVTDSFHGTAFAINYNVDFVDILPSGTATRNLSILSLMGLSNRVVKDKTDFSFIKEKIDYSKVNEVLDTERQRSKQILEMMITGEKNAH